MPVVNNLPSSSLSDDDLLKINSNLDEPLDTLIKSYLGNEGYTLMEFIQNTNKVFRQIRDGNVGQFSAYAVPVTETVSGYDTSFSVDGGDINTTYSACEQNDLYTYPEQAETALKFIAPYNGTYSIGVVRANINDIGNDVGGIVVITATDDLDANGKPIRWKHGIIYKTGTSLIENEYIESCYAHAGEIICVKVMGYLKAVTLEAINVSCKLDTRVSRVCDGIYKWNGITLS